MPTPAPAPKETVCPSYLSPTSLERQLLPSADKMDYTSEHNRLEALSKQDWRRHHNSLKTLSCTNGIPLARPVPTSLPFPRQPSPLPAFVSRRLLGVATALGCRVGMGVSLWGGQV